MLRVGLLAETIWIELSLNRISAIAPPLKKDQNDARGSARVKTHREIAPGIEVVARYQYTLERAGSYPNSNQRPVVGDHSQFRKVNWLAAVALILLS